MDTATALRVLAHELRMPTSVIQGYVRLLRDGLLDEPDRDRALTQIQQATGRLSDLARDASSVAQWLTAPPNGGVGDTHLSAILGRAASTATLEFPPALAIPAELGATPIATSNVQALSAALVRLIEAIAREAPHEVMAIQARAAGGEACDVIVTPGGSTAVSMLEGFPPDGPGAEPVTLVRGGLGLTFLLAAAVFDAHGATLWTRTGSRGMILRLPFLSQARHS